MKCIGTPDGGFVISGRGPIPTGAYKAFFFKVNSAGVVQWCFKIDDTLPNLDKLVYATEPIITSAGDVVILGFCDKADSATDDALIVKLNAEGQVQWLKTYGLPSSNFRMYEILEMPDAHLIVATSTYTNVEESMQVVKLDPQGNIVANVQYAFSNYEWVEEIFLDLEGNIVIVSGDDIKPDSTLACSCASGYTGQKCQFLESEIDQLISTTNTAISDVTQNYGSMQPVEALSQAAFLSAAPDLVP